MVCLRNRLHDGQTEAGAVRAARSGTAGEALEDALAVGLSDARTGVPDPDPSLLEAHGGAESDRVAFRRVQNGVLRQLKDGLGEPLAICQDDPFAPAFVPPIARSQPLHLARELLRERREVDRLAGEKTGLLGLRQQDQVVDYPAHAVELVEDDRERLAPFLGIVLEQLQVAPHDRDGRPQLVTGVVDEAALRREGRFEPVEHLVERRGELRDLVGALHRDAAAEVALRDLVRGARDRPDRAEDSLGQTPGQKRAD